MNGDASVTSDARTRNGLSIQVLRGALAQMDDSAVMTDLAPELESDMPGWWKHPSPLVINDARSHERHGYFNQLLVISEHTGAHVDAPVHAHASMPRATIDVVPVDYLFGIFKKYDLADRILEPGDLISAKALQEIERRDDFQLHAGDIALIDFGWSRYWRPSDRDPERRQWWGINSPGLTEDACGYLAGSGCRAVGSDTFACDVAAIDGKEVASFGHETYFLPRGILIVECLQNLGKLPPTGLFLAMPLRIKGGSGSPLRPIAIHSPRREPQHG